ncbi:hypothetical protein PG993_011976 [Apiospora rasikravindrae]|uniref:Uncharacterized protein n=1 Tax=Apiospora rasikravindrae TaxID=990691 RepID=A0ABR1S157_9PEZI
MPRRAARTRQQLVVQQQQHQLPGRQDLAQPPQLVDKLRRRHPRRTPVQKGQRKGRLGRRLGQQREQQLGQQKRRRMLKAQTPCQQDRHQQR